MDETEGLAWSWGKYMLTLEWSDDAEFGNMYQVRVITPETAGLPENWKDLLRGL
jgi:hypothetical protein